MGTSLALRASVSLAAHRSRLSRSSQGCWEGDIHPHGLPPEIRAQVSQGPGPLPLYGHGHMSTSAVSVSWGGSSHSSTDQGPCCGRP